jgi:tripartite ATP-independent transporter DctM subunit
VLLDIALPILLLVALLAINVPVAFSLLAAGSIGLLIVGDVSAVLSVYETSPYRSTANYLLVTVPMFILMAELASLGGLTRSLFDAVARLFRRVDGGLGIATVQAAGVLAAVSGSSTASAAAMARIAVPEMMRNGYSASLAMGIVSVAGTFAIMIPPSIALVLYAVIAEVSIGRILMAGVVPGILSVLVHSLLVRFLWRHWRGARADAAATAGAPAADGATASADEPVGALLVRTVPIVLLIVAVLGGIYSGIVTPTEASAVGALGALVVGSVFGELDARRTLEALRRTALTTTMIFAIVIGATIFGYYTTFSRGIDLFVGTVGGLPVPEWMVLGAILLALIVLGLFMDQIAIMLLTLPVLVPIVDKLGFDLIWFGIVFVKIVEIGLVTPPVGMNVFVTASAVKLPVEQAFRGITMLLPGELLVLAALLAFPPLTLWLPSLMVR